MRKTTLLLVFVASLLASTALAKTNTLIPTYFVNESFTSAATYPTGWSQATMLYNTATITAGWSTPAANQLNVVGGSQSGTRGMTINFPTSGTEPTVYVDFDWLITSAMVGQKNALGMILSDDAGLPVLGIYACGSDAKFHVWNLQKDSVVFTNQGSFFRASSVNIATTDTRNVNTQVNFPYTTGLYNIQATLDFTNKKVSSLTITKKSDNTFITVTDLSFISAQNLAGVYTPMATLATSVSKISLVNTRSSAGGNGSNSNISVSLDNFKTYKLVDVQTDKVTVNYKDGSGNTLKASRDQLNVQIGSTYTATTDDKTTFTDATNYYTYDATSTDNVVVASGGSVIDLKFKIVPITAGTYTWTGTISSLWNNVNENFTTDGLNSIIYQSTNPVVFNASASNKTVTVNDAINLGSANATIGATGYAINGLGTLNGTGSLLINLTGSDVLTLGITNNMTGTTQIAGGSVTFSKTGALGTSVNLSGGAKLIAGATGLIIPPTTFTVSDTIKTGTYLNTLANGMTAGTGVKISVISGGNYASADATRAFDFAASGTLDLGSELELTGTGTDNRFGMTTASTSYLANTKVTLKGVAMFYINSTQGAATTISVGTLAGDAGTKLGWGRTSDLTRTITWSVGAANENSIFAGSLTNTGGYSTSGSSYIGNLTNLIKEGTGTLTMSGTANTHNGNFTVNGGSLNVTGSIGNATSVITVAAAGKLTGTGTVGGATTVNGILEGRLNFGSSLTLAGTANLTVNGFATTQFDSITVAGALTNGGTLNITVNAAAPAVNTSIKLIKAGTYSGSFTTVNLPSNYTFDATTGILTYTLGTKTANISSNNVNVYPTLSNNDVHVNAENISSIEVVNLMGQSVKQIKTTANNNTINLTGLSNGAYFVKVQFTDGSVKAQRILFQK